MCSLDNVFIPGDRMQPQGPNTPHKHLKILLPARDMEFLQAPLILILIEILICPLSLPTNTSTFKREEVGVSNYRIVPYNIILFIIYLFILTIGLCRQDKCIIMVSITQVTLRQVQLALTIMTQVC